MSTLNQRPNSILIKYEGGVREGNKKTFYYTCIYIIKDKIAVYNGYNQNMQREREREGGKRELGIQ